MKILVTGGTGYIGSHTVVELLNEDYEVVVIDDLSNSKIETVDRIKLITGKDFKFYEGDIRDKGLLTKIFKENEIECVIHFAGYKAVGESVKLPLKYYDNNIGGTINLLEVMNEFNCKKIVFSSSATVYGKPERLPIVEDSKLETNCPYGNTKLMIEYILKDLYNSDNSWRVVLLRYFNPIGAHESGLIGEDPNDIPNNLMPYIMKVAMGELPILNIFGDDYDTVDGTGVRDYIHVVDLSVGHIKALEKIEKNPGLFIYNLGTGKGSSVLEVINTFEKVNGVKINYKITDRRPGDIDACYADVEKAKKELGFVAKYDLEKMCKDSYNFIKKAKETK